MNFCLISHSVNNNLNIEDACLSLSILRLQKGKEKKRMVFSLIETISILKQARFIHLEIQSPRKDEET